MVQTPEPRTLAIEETDRLIASDKVEGTKVYDLRGNKLGSVMNFMVDKSSGRVEYAVIEFGGLLGFDREYFPLPWQVLQYDPKLGGYAVDLDKERLEKAPRFHDTSVWDETYGRGVYGYYGLVYPGL